MSINNLTLSQNMTAELDKAVCGKTVTGFFTDNNLRGKFVGAKTVLIPHVSVSGLGDYDRDTGFVRGSISVGSTPVVLSMDRGRSFQLDREDNDETGIADLAGQIMGEFVRTQVVPEVDAYVLSKLAGYAVTKTQTVTGTPATDAYTMFMDAVAKAQNAVGYDEELVCFVDSAMWKAIQQSDDLTRLIDVARFTRGGIETEVKAINGIPVLPVPDSRMKSAYEFYDGIDHTGESGADESNGGFVPATSAKNVGMIVCPKRAASLVKKTEQVRTFDPASNPNADAWKFDYRLYYDVFVRDSLGGGIYAYTYSAT